MKLDAYFKAKFSLSLEQENHLEPIIQVQDKYIRNLKEPIRFPLDAHGSENLDYARHTQEDTLSIPTCLCHMILPKENVKALADSGIEFLFTEADKAEVNNEIEKLRQNLM